MIPGDRWRFLRRPIISEPDRVGVYTRAAIALHNYMRTTESTVYCPPGFIDGEDGSGSIIERAWRTDSDPCSSLEPIARAGGNRLVLYIQMIIVKVHTATSSQ